jgi:hypothetical protein
MRVMAAEQPSGDTRPLRAQRNGVPAGRGTPGWRGSGGALAGLWRGVETLWKRFANAPMTSFWCVACRGPRTTSKQRRSTRSAVFEAKGRHTGFMRNRTREHSRIAFCECGAQLAGDSRGQLFDAAQAHLAHHHPELLGALGPEMVQQMVEERPGAVNA